MSAPIKWPARPGIAATAPVSPEPPVIIWLPGTVRGKGRPRFVRATGRNVMLGAVSIVIIAHFAVPESYSRLRREACLAGRTRPTVKPDWDNIAKLTDALNGIVWQDDKQITDATFAKRYSAKPGLSIQVEVVQ